LSIIVNKNSKKHNFRATIDSTVEHVNQLRLEAVGLHLDSAATLQTLMGQQLWFHSPMRSVHSDKVPILAQHAEQGAFSTRERFTQARRSCLEPAPFSWKWTCRRTVSLRRTGVP